MLCIAASQMAIKVMVLYPVENCPINALSYHHMVGSFDDSPTVREFDDSPTVREFAKWFYFYEIDEFFFFFFFIVNSFCKYILLL